MTKYIWMTKLRYFWLFIQIFLILIAEIYGYLSFDNLTIVLGLNIILILINFYIRRNLIRGLTDSFGTKYQLDGDILLFVLFLSFSGGTQNPFYPFFFILIFLQGLFSSQNNPWSKILVVLITTFILQVLPYRQLGLEGVLTGQTIPYLIIYFSLPLITFFISRSLGLKLDQANSLLDQIQRKEDNISRLQALGAMSAGLSHEFASPLNAAKLRVERLKKKWPLDEDVQECSEALSDCTETIHLIGKVHRDLDSAIFEKIDNNRISSIIEQWHNNHQEVEIDLNLEEIEIKAPLISFTQTLINLLNNALEARPVGGIIEVHFFQGEQNKILSITDNGPGFMPSILSRLGQPFNTSKSTGTGLGLYSSELFMSSVGGELKVYNNAQGASVELYFL